MAITKKNFNVVLPKLILFSYLILFPFGNILRITISSPVVFSFPFIDIPPLAAVMWYMFAKPDKPKIAQYFVYFIFAAAFSLLISVFIFRSFSPVSLFYLIRLISYYCFFILTWNIFQINSVKPEENRKLIFTDLLLYVIIVICIFGWLQYFIFPDLRALKFWGWDDHLYRLTGTFLDPGYTGLIIVLGIVISVTKYTYYKKWVYISASIFFILTLALTYSRASYLAFIGSIIFFIFGNPKLYKIKRLLIVLVLVFLASLPFLPRPAGYGVRLERTHSITARLGNYLETGKIISFSPLFGVGYNTLCSTRNTLFGNIDPASHSCAGSDSSLLFIVATTGIVGLILTINFSIKMMRSVENSLMGTVWKTSAVAIVIHSFFSNSLFYPWILGWMAILSAMSLNSKKVKENI